MVARKLEQGIIQRLVVSGLEIFAGLGVNQAFFIKRGDELRTKRLQVTRFPRVFTKRVFPDNFFRDRPDCRAPAHLFALSVIKNKTVIRYPCFRVLENLVEKIEHILVRKPVVAVEFQDNRPRIGLLEPDKPVCALAEAFVLADVFHVVVRVPVQPFPDKFMRVVRGCVVQNYLPDKPAVIILVVNGIKAFDCGLSRIALVGHDMKPHRLTRSSERIPQHLADAAHAPARSRGYPRPAPEFYKKVRHAGIIPASLRGVKDFPAGIWDVTNFLRKCGINWYNYLMESKSIPLKVLYIEAGHGLGGSAKSLVACIKNLPPGMVEPLVFLAHPEATGELFDAAGIRTVRISAFGSPFPEPGGRIKFVKRFFNDLMPAARAAAAFIRNNGILVAHGNNDVSSNMAGLLGAYLAGVSYVQHLRTTRPPTRSERLAARLVKRFITVSSWGADRLAEVFPRTRGRMSAIRDVFEKPEISGDLPRDLPPGDSPRVGIFSNLVQGKGHDVFLDAANILLKDGLDAQFFIFGGRVAGHEDYYDRIKSAVESGSFPEKIRFMGFKENVQDYMAVMDVVVEASSLPEGLQRTLAEAALLGRALVATDTGGVRDLVEDGVTGILVPTASNEALAGAVRRLVVSERERKSLGAAAAKRAGVLFDISDSVAALYSLYMDIV